MANELIEITEKRPTLPRFSSKTQKRAGLNIIKFMAVLLVLTIIARGASGATLAVVYTANPSRSEIIQAVNGNATVSSTDTLDIFVPEGLTITEVLAIVGQSVKSGEAVAKLDIHEISTKIIRENATLEKMLLDLETLERDESVDTNSLSNNQRYLNRANEDYNSVRRQGEADVAKAQAELNKAQSELTEATNRANAAATAAATAAANNAGNSTDDGSDTDSTTGTDPDTPSIPVIDHAAEIAEKQAAVDRARDALESAQRRAHDDLLNATRRIEDAQSSLSAARQDHERNMNRHSDTVEGNRISATTLRLEIEEQTSVVERLQALMEDDGTVFTDTAGVVAKVKNKNDTTGKDALLTLKDATKGFEAIMLLGKVDADKLAIGSACEVTTGGGTMYYMPTVTGTVAAKSLPDDDDMVEVTIRLPQGDWTEGQRVDVSAVQDHSVHEMCVPLSALRSDNSGYFVLLIEQRSTVLGVENVIYRVPVMVMASDRENVSVQGPIGRGSQIITGSSKPVSEGDRVRFS